MSTHVTPQQEDMGSRETQSCQNFNRVYNTICSVSPHQIVCPSSAHQPNYNKIYERFSPI